MLAMSKAEEQAYKEALSQPGQTIGARNARVLAEYILRNMTSDIDSSSFAAQVIKADPGSTVQGVKQTIIK